MLNYIWAVMLGLGILYGALSGNMKEVTEAALSSAGEAVSLCITMAGVMALWVGLMEIAEKSGLLLKLTRALSPFISFMFPEIPREHKARDYISMNIIANVLGLGWACTPAGLKAMEALAELEEERKNPEYGKDGNKAGRPLCSLKVRYILQRIVILERKGDFAQNLAILQYLSHAVCGCSQGYGEFAYRRTGGIRNHHFLRPHRNC